MASKTHNRPPGEPASKEEAGSSEAFSGGAESASGDLTAVLALGHGWIREEGVELGRDSFGEDALRYNALPEMALGDVSLASTFAGKEVAAPLIISCMTGGAGERFERINRNLAIGARELNIPLGLGSMRVLLQHAAAESSFKVRQEAGQVPLIANLGLVSFNHGLVYEDVERIIDMVQPDVFGLHLNALQEVIQEGGDNDFRGLLGHLEHLARRCPLPVYVKECGGGIAPGLVRKLFSAGAAYVDISGNDGTSWAAVEGRLSADPSLGELFRDFGLPTAWILERLSPSVVKGGRVVASGGIRNGLQAVKALALGARWVGVARPFFLAAEHSAEAVVALGSRILTEMRTALFLLGVKTPQALNRSHFLDR